MLKKAKETKANKIHSQAGEPVSIPSRNSGGNQGGVALPMPRAFPHFSPKFSKVQGSAPPLVLYTNSSASGEQQQRTMLFQEP